MVRRNVCRKIKKQKVIDSRIQTLLRILGGGRVPWRPGKLLPVYGEHVVVAGHEVFVLDEVRPESRGLVREAVEQDLHRPAPARWKISLYRIWVFKIPCIIETAYVVTKWCTYRVTHSVVS